MYFVILIDMSAHIACKKSLAASGIRLSLLILVSRILGLVREMTKAAFLGTSSLADAFGISFLIPNLCRRLFAENSISVAFIPTFRTYIEDIDSDEKRQETKQFIAATFTLVSFLTAAVVAVGIAFAPFIVRLFYNKGDDALISETTLLTRIMFPYLAVISVAAFFQGILNGVNIFSPSGFTPILFNAAVILSAYVLSPHLANPARAMAVGVTAGGCIQALFQLPFVIRTGWNVSFTSIKRAFSNEGSRKVMALVGPTIVGMAAYQLNDIVSTAIAGKAGEGIVSSLQYSLRLQELILGIFAVSVSSVILPDMSGMAKRKDWNSFSSMLLSAMQIIVLITVPVTFYSLAAGKDIISLVYKNKHFTDESVRLTLSAFRFHIAGLCFIALNRVVAPAFYAQGNTKLPTLSGLIGFAVNIALVIPLAAIMKGGGIALALTVASAVNTVLLFVFLAKTPVVNIARMTASTAIYIAKIAAFSAVSILPVRFIMPVLQKAASGRGRLISYGIPAAVAGVVFALTGIALLVLTKDPVLLLIARKTKREKKVNI